MKPIYLNDDQKEAMRKEFERSLKKGLIMRDKFSVEMTCKFTKSEQESQEKAILVISPLAYAKICAVVAGFQTEVAWYGLTKRVDEEKPYFFLRDIVVYPQTVTGSTVVMEDEDNFWKSMSEEDALNMRFHGHSHVNMACQPSTTDMDHRELELRLLPKDSYQIFMIWNKRLEFTSTIYDCKHNIQYENADVQVTVGTEDFSFLATDYVEDLKKIVVEKKTSVINGFTSGTPATQKSTASKAQDSKLAKKAEKAAKLPATKQERSLWQQGWRWNPYKAEYEQFDPDHDYDFFDENGDYQGLYR